MPKSHVGTPVKLVAMFMSLYFGAVSLCSSNTPQTHDVPAFHNDEGLGLLQDCTFMVAIANGTVAQVLYSLQESETNAVSCLPSVELNWLEVLSFVTKYMEDQPKENLSSKSYGVWIMHSLHELYPCK